MENHLQVLAALEKRHILLGNSASICRAVRDPKQIASCFQKAKLKYPRLCSMPVPVQLHNTDWLVKPLRSAGGQDIHHYERDRLKPSEQYYFQQYIEGESRAGVYVGDGKTACLLGVTRQLVGEAFLHADEFSYCGSIGPVQLSDSEYEQWLRIGETLTAAFGLKGLFGVDAISQAGIVYPLEINPRYTASMEVVELASGLPLIAMHCAGCEGKTLAHNVPATQGIIAKACLFAGQMLQAPVNIEILFDSSAAFPLTADIPQPGTVIQSGHPVMTILTRANSENDAMQILMNRAESLYGRFIAV
jgi:predicted ATP-grasp superfamily ATP-dependent carboligase